ncbi:MAG: hypothetical protein RIT45_4395 [Pseudomonadota bacterium]
MMPTAFLHEIDGGGGVRASHPIEKMVCSIGTDKHSDIRLRGRGLAPVHAQVRVAGEGVRIEAVGGERLVVNGKRTDARALQPGDVIDLGAVRLRFDMKLKETRETPAAHVAASGSLKAMLASAARFSEALAGSYQVDDLLATMLDEMIEITDAARGAVLLVVDDKPQLRAAREAGRKPSRGEFPISDTIVARVIATRMPEIVRDALNDTMFSAARSVLDFKLASVLCVPLMVRGELLGVIYLGNDNVVNLFNRDALDVATVFAAQAAMVLRNAILIRELQVSNESLTQQLERIHFGSLIGTSGAMKEVFRKIDKVARTDVSVLIEGETGTGKELVASELHRRSHRENGPFIVINCGAIPENLLESELFGHVKGSFTGAVNTRDGKFQAADGGTLFLDEVGEMPLNLQVKLLRVLEERRVTRIGESQARDVDIRVVAATNRNLAEEVRSGNFREDLYYRLNVVRLELPPLRERGSDVELLGRYFLRKYGDELGVPASSFADDAVRALRGHRWPGNIRELENRIKKAVIFCDAGIVKAEDLDLQEASEGRVLPLNEAKEQFALDYVRRILEQNDGNRTQTAKELGVDVRTIFRYLEKVRQDGDELS